MFIHRIGLAFFLAIRALANPLTNNNVEEVFQFHNAALNCTVPICTGPLAEIYCHGEIIDVSAQFGLDHICPGPQLAHDVPIVLANFRKLTYPIKRNEFISFCEENFRNASYLSVVVPVDWQETPRYFNLIKNKRHRRLADFINLRWKNLTRRFVDDVFTHPNLYPVMPVQNSFVVPGGFFQSYYYWDSYWINKGLLASDMFATVKGILDNFADIITELGYIPNGGYLYHQRRTQPPLFVRMVEDYYVSTKNLDAVREWMPALEREMKFFNANRSIEEGPFKGMYVYRANSNCPRPENYLSDLRLAITADDAMFTWHGMATACESGWDFSSRWFAHEGSQAYEKRSIRTQRIVPVDLNVYMALDLYLMAKFFEDLKDYEKASQYHSLAVSIEEKIHKFFWNEEYGAWFDVDMDTQKQRVAFYPSNIFPLLLNNSSPLKSRKVIEYLNRTNVLQFPGGIPSSDPVKSTEQWDFPNVWAPLEHQFIRSMWASENDELIALGNAQAELFVAEVYNGLFEAPQDNGGLWEKYDARTKSGHPGEGGEYAVQEGFGWTNGAVLDLIIHLTMNEFSSIPEPLVVSSAVRKDMTDHDSSSFLGGPPHLYILLVLIALLLALLLIRAFRFSNFRTSNIRHIYQISPPSSNSFLLRGIKNKSRSRSTQDTEEPLLCDEE